MNELKLSVTAPLVEIVHTQFWFGEYDELPLPSVTTPVDAVSVTVPEQGTTLAGGVTTTDTGTGVAPATGLGCGPRTGVSVVDPDPAALYVALNPVPCTELSAVKAMYIPPDEADTGGGTDVPESEVSRVPELLCPAYTFK